MEKHVVSWRGAASLLKPINTLDLLADNSSSMLDRHRLSTCFSYLEAKYPNKQFEKAFSYTNYYLAAISIFELCPPVGHSLSHTSPNAVQKSFTKHCMLKFEYFQVLCIWLRCYFLNGINWLQPTKNDTLTDQIFLDYVL